VDFTAIYLIGLPAALYLRAGRVLQERGYRIPALQQACWYGGLSALGAAVLSPLDRLGETDLVAAHMGQHLLIADVAAPLLVLGLRSPAYAFMLPRPLFTPLARSRPLRATFRFVQKPLIAASIFVAAMWLWHLAPAYEAALTSPIVHALQHQVFLLAGVIFWIPVIEPRYRRVPGGLWKIAYIGGTRLLTMFVGFALVATRHPIYEGFYGDRAAEHGLTPLDDQQIAGGMMMVIDIVVMLGSLVFFFLRTAADDARGGRGEPPVPADISPETLAAAAEREGLPARSPDRTPATPAGSDRRLG
jgi:cytochrome c oxidase assembly factor CtaG